MAGPDCDAPPANPGELRRSRLAPLILALYRLTGSRRRWRVGRVLIGACLRLEGGGMFSATARRIMAEFHGVRVGPYSYGELFDPALVPPGVTVGRYCSFARGARMVVQNHPMDRVSTHPFFYESVPGVAATADIPPGELHVGNDVWVGMNAIITPGCRRVGDGAVIGAGAVVTRDVPDYAVVAGVPAKKVRDRLPPEAAARLKQSRWWDRPAGEVREDLPRLNALLAGGGPAGPAASVVIPAHNEEAVIARCLRALLDGAGPGELEVVVACNGCTDRTAEIARSFGPGVRVVETAAASKVAGLNLGDAAATAFPRFYLDADIALTADAVRRTARLLGPGGKLAAAPRAEWDLSRSSPLVRAFYAVWRHQPYFDDGRLGSGVYAVSEAGHARLGRFPDLTADDEYVRLLFAPHERATADCRFTVTPPRHLRDLVRIKTRSRRGNLELAAAYPHMAPRAAGARGALALRVLHRPWLWPAAAVYLYVVAATGLKARRTLRRAGPRIWERDSASREAAVSNS